MHLIDGALLRGPGKNFIWLCVLSTFNNAFKAGL